MNGFRLGEWRFGEKHVIGADVDAAGVERSPLLVRWVVFRCKTWGVYVYKLHRSDYERSLHDLRPFVSIMLKGCSWEHRDRSRDNSATQVLRERWMVGERCRLWGFFL